MVITLIGYRGSGKSAVAAPLAERLGWRWIDADTELERRAGRTIREIFQAEGEPYFRKLETELLAELLAEDRLVIAAGGGAVLQAENRRRMKSAGPVVWLQASVDTLHRRIEADETTADRRPNLTASGGRREIEELLARREPLYRECSTLQVTVDGCRISQIVMRIHKSVADIVEKGAEP